MIHNLKVKAPPLQWRPNHAFALDDFFGRACLVVFGGFQRKMRENRKVFSPKETRLEEGNPSSLKYCAGDCALFQSRTTSLFATKAGSSRGANPLTLLPSGQSAP